MEKLDHRVQTGKILMEYLFRNKEEASKNSKLSFFDKLYHLVFLIISLSTLIPTSLRLYKQHNWDKLTLLMFVVTVVVIMTALHFEKKRYSTPFFGISDYELVCYPFSRNRVIFKMYRYPDNYLLTQSR